MAVADDEDDDLVSLDVRSTVLSASFGLSESWVSFPLLHPVSYPMLTLPPWRIL